MHRPKKEVESIPMDEISSSKKAVMGKDIQSNRAKKNRCMLIGGISALLLLILAGATFAALWAAKIIKTGKIVAVGKQT